MVSNGCVLICNYFIPLCRSLSIGSTGKNTIASCCCWGQCMQSAACLLRVLRVADGVCEAVVDSCEARAVGVPNPRHLQYWQ